MASSVPGGPAVPSAPQAGWADYMYQNAAAAGGAVRDGAAALGGAAYNGAAAVGGAVAAGVNGLANGMDQVLRVAIATERSVNLLMNSTALQKVTYASIASGAYIIAPQITAESAIGARARFVEAGLISYACVVHSLVMAAVWGIAALVQLGESARANYEAKHALILLLTSAVCMGVSLCGVISPEMGARATGSLYEGIWQIHATIENFEGQQPQQP